MNSQHLSTLVMYCISLSAMFVLITFICLHQTYAKNNDLPASYQQDQAWKQLQQYLPKPYQLTDKNLPEEWFWRWKNGDKIHVDHYPNPEAKARIILLHGVGTNGRQMSLILGHPLAQKGYETIALDLPGYGLTQVSNPKEIVYSHWVELVNDFINEQYAKDKRPIFLYGLSAGGMLTLHVASINPHVKGIIGMTFLDQQNQQVQKETMRFSPLSRINLLGLRLLNKTPASNLKLPMSLVSKMYALTNNPQALKVMLKDPKSAGNAMSIKFLESYMYYQPPVAIDLFRQCPVLLTQPAKDHWTPLYLSEPVLKQLQVPYKVVMLPNGGHYPLEASALDTLQQAAINFIETYK